MDKSDNQKQKTEELILEAAKKVFLQKGMHGARMQDIADEAGINKAMLHYYFRSKEKLFEIIFLEMFGKLMPRVQEILGSHRTVVEKLELFVESYLDLLLENPYVPIFIINEMHKNPDLLIQKLKLNNGHGFPNLPEFLLQVQREVQEGKIRAVEPLQLMLNVVAMCVFPFLGKPMLQHIAALDDATYLQLMRQRKASIIHFLRMALTP